MTPVRVDVDDDFATVIDQGTVSLSSVKIEFGLSGMLGNVVAESLVSGFGRSQVGRQDLIMLINH